MYPADTLAYPTEDARRYLPLERIYVLSVGEFERLIAAAMSPELDLPNILEECVAADAIPETAVFFFEQFLDKKRIPRTCSVVVTGALDSAQARLDSAVERGASR
jgi:hypothetical protein